MRHLITSLSKKLYQCIKYYIIIHIQFSYVFYIHMSTVVNERVREGRENV